MSENSYADAAGTVFAIFFWYIITQTAGSIILLFIDLYFGL